MTNFIDLVYLCFLQCVNYQIKINNDSVNGLDSKNFTQSRF